MTQDDLPDLIQRRYARFTDRLKESDVHGGAEEFGKLLTLMRRHDLKQSPRLQTAFFETFIDLFWQFRRHDLMLQAADDAIQFFGADPEWLFARGEALFYLSRFQEARDVLEPLTTEDFEEPMIYYLLGCLAERRGEDEAAHRLFQSAHRLDSKGFIVPAPIEEEAVVRCYEQCLAELPEAIRWQIRDVPIYVNTLPSDDLLRETSPQIDPLVLGLFMGRPRGEETSSWASDQPRILLFHKNIAKHGGDVETIEDELRKTLFHEVGHYLGFDEDQLEEMGLA